MPETLWSGRNALCFGIDTVLQLIHVSFGSVLGL